MVYLSNSKLSVAVLGNLGFAVALGMYRFLTWVRPPLPFRPAPPPLTPSPSLPAQTFLGRLRDSEVERINDKVGQAVVETLLAMTIFRQDFTAGFFAAFVVLSFVKIFHWMVQDRVDFIETTPNVSRGQHARIVAFIALLIAADVALLRHALESTLAKGVSISLLFAFEYAIQASTAVCTLCKYTLSVFDMATEGRWEGKGRRCFLPGPRPRSSPSHHIFSVFRCGVYDVRNPDPSCTGSVLDVP
jgi:E3 ubiquitin-protein ligase synoviolin